MDMIRKEFTVRFNTPAFMGDAEQKGAWRTPPFKALLRQWWRVAVAPAMAYDYQKIREEEGKLFGHAWLKDEKGKHWAMKSQVLVRLEPWEQGDLTRLNKIGQVCHPELNNPKMQPCPSGKPGRMVAAEVYLGFGPLGTKGLNFERALSTSKPANLILGFPKEHEESMGRTTDLIQAFGTLGARSRNGWGTIVLENGGCRDAREVLKDWAFLVGVARDIRECLHRDWPHALGRGADGRLLLWQTPHKDTWEEILKELARVKIAFRTNLKFVRTSGDIEERHILAYPVTHHDHVKGWGKESRLANQLRFKVLRDTDGKYFGIAFHIPCKLPSSLKHDSEWSEERQLKVWNKVHAVLDKEMTRIEEQGGAS